MRQWLFLLASWICFAIAGLVLASLISGCGTYPDNALGVNGVDCTTPGVARPIGIYKCTAHISNECQCSVEDNPFVQNGAVYAYSQGEALDCWQDFWEARDPGLRFISCIFIQPYQPGPGGGANSVDIIDAVIHDAETDR
jgi:hypothetical protein